MPPCDSGERQETAAYGRGQRFLFMLVLALVLGISAALLIAVRGAMLRIGTPSF